MGHVVQLSSARWFHNYSESRKYFLTVWLRDCNFENTECWETCSELTKKNSYCLAHFCILMLLQYMSSGIYAGHASPNGCSANKTISTFLISSLKNTGQGIFSGCICRNTHRLSVSSEGDLRYSSTQNRIMQWQHLQPYAGLYQQAGPGKQRAPASFWGMAEPWPRGEHPGNAVCPGGLFVVSHREKTAMFLFF